MSGYKIKTCFLSMLAFCILLGPGNLGAQNSATEGVKDNETIRFGVLRKIMGVVNENDVNVAISVWAKSLAKELGSPVEPIVSTYSALSEVKTDLEENRVDLVFITTPHLFALQSLIAEDGFFASKQSGTITEEYILLVHQTSSANDVRDMKGNNLRVLDNARTSLSLNWLNVFLLEKGLGRPREHFKNYKMISKINEAVLPVFFKQADACLVTQKGFDILAELNPQIARQMKIIATSPSYIPVILCFRKTYQSQVKQVLLRDMQKIVESSSGGQLLTIFQMDGMQQISKEELTDSMFVLKKDHSLSGLPEFGKAKGADN